MVKGPAKIRGCGLITAKPSLRAFRLRGKIWNSRFLQKSYSSPSTKPRLLPTFSFCKVGRFVDQSAFAFSIPKGQRCAPPTIQLNGIHQTSFPKEFRYFVGSHSRLLPGRLPSTTKSTNRPSRCCPRAVRGLRSLLGSEGFTAITPDRSNLA